MSLLALQDLFQHHRGKATGLWKLGVEPNRTVFFDSGDIVFAQSTHATDRLTYLLVERGKLTQAQLDYALANLKPGLSIGKNLIEMGFITQRDLLDVARAQVERVVQGAMGTPGLVPTFEERELDATVVRLPLDTPQLLLNGMLNLQDRERLLELLGPLNQVVVLQGRRLLEMSLPADLSKLPPLLDGTHTLLELSRESFAEPLRLGAFALFLREIGWARLHEMPPLDRQALDMALTSELEPLSSPFPEPFPPTVPSLFSTIEDAARPTTNLEHLSHALDAMPEPEVARPFATAPPPGPEGGLAYQEDAPLVTTPTEPALDDFGFAAETGQAILPTPPLEIPEPIFEPEPQVTIQRSTLTDMEVREPLPESPVFPEPAVGRRSLVPVFGGILLGLAVVGGGVWWRKHSQAPRVVEKAPKEAPKIPKASTPSGIAVPPSEPHVAIEPVKKEPLQAEPQKTEPPKPEPVRAKAPVIGTSIADRVEALRKGDLDLAVKQGEALVREASKNQWSLRLEIACMGDTLRRAVDFFPDGKPDLFIVPMVLRDGRTCYQVYYGRFPSEAVADKQAASLPAAFREGGNRPKVFRTSELPTRQ